MKVAYEVAEMEVVNFVTEDVIATSGETTGGLINGGAGSGGVTSWEDFINGNI